MKVNNRIALKLEKNIYIYCKKLIMKELNFTFTFSLSLSLKLKFIYSIKMLNSTFQRLLGITSIVHGGWGGAFHFTLLWSLSSRYYNSNTDTQ